VHPFVINTYADIDDYAKRVKAFMGWE